MFFNNEDGIRQALHGVCRTCLSCFKLGDNRIIK